MTSVIVPDGIFHLSGLNFLCNLSFKVFSLVKQGSDLIDLQLTQREMENLIFGSFFSIFGDIIEYFGDFLRSFGEIRSLREEED